MTKKQISDALRTHRAQRDFYLDYLNRYYYDLEQRNQETEYINRYLFHKRAVEELENEVPDD